MMGMTYADATAHLNSLAPELAPPRTESDGSTAPRRKFDLAHMRALSGALGDAHTLVPSILIAGTNGKGSTAATLAAILSSAGYRAGLYTSPHLSRVNERIQLAHPVLPGEYGSANVPGTDGPLTLGPIGDEDFARAYTLVHETATRLVDTGELPQEPSFFERLTMVAFVYFAGLDTPDGARRADILVLEVGLGGRLDATNIVMPLLSILTDISLDHQEYLGGTIALIAAEKCGILRQDGVVVTLAQHPEANQVIGEFAMRLNVQGVDAAAYLPPAERNSENQTAAASSLRGNHYEVVLKDAAEPGVLEVDSPLAGAHQRRNIALALAASLALRNQFGYKISNAALAAGVRGTCWPGRLQWLEPGLLLDVAHNLAGAWALRSAIAALPEQTPRTLLFSCLADKDLRAMTQVLFPLFDSSPDADPARSRDAIILVPIANPRATSLAELLAAAKAMGVKALSAATVSEGLALARKITPLNGVILATGSVYLVGAVRELAEVSA